MLIDTLDRLAAVEAQRIVAFTPSEAEADFMGLARGRYRLIPQSSGDLGARLSTFFRQQFEADADSVVVVGTDSPTLPVEFVERAFAELEHADVVLGPATDGGYYLVGLQKRGQVHYWWENEPAPFFEGISWGSATVLAETVARLRDPARRLALLPPWYDVDTPADWALLRGHVAALRRAGIDPGIPHTEALLEPLVSVFLNLRQ